MRHRCRCPTTCSRLENDAHSIYITLHIPRQQTGICRNRNPPTHPRFHATLTMYSVNHHTEKHIKTYWNECELQLNFMYVFMEWMLIPNAFKIYVTSGKQFCMERTIDRRTCRSVYSL